MRQAGDEPLAPSVRTGRPDDGDRLGGLLCRPGRPGSPSHDDINLELDQLGDEHRESVDFAVCESHLDNDVPALDPAVLAQHLPKHGEQVLRHVAAVGPKEPNSKHFLRLLRYGGERHREKRTRDRAEKGAPIHHWITSSARSSNDWGILTPSFRAATRLMTNSILVGCSTGRSAGLVPFNTAST